MTKRLRDALAYVSARLDLTDYEQDRSANLWADGKTPRGIVRMIRQERALAVEYIAKRAMSNTAKQIANRFNNDGQSFEDAQGSTLDDLCNDFDGTQEWRDGWQSGDVYAWRFADGSGIVVAGDAWDLALDEDCWCWEGVGHSEEVDGACRGGITHWPK